MLFPTTSLHSYLRLLACSAALLTGACTETIIREYPQTGGTGGVSPAASALQDASNSTDTGSGNSGAAQTTHGNNTNNVAANASNEAANGAAGTTTEPIPQANLTPLDTNTVVGEAGAIVDCQQQLPCRWVSDDSQFSITATNADNIGERSNLSVNYQVDTLHDTSVQLSGSSEAIGANGTHYSLTRQALGNGNGIAAHGLEAGASLTGSLTYDRTATSASLFRWSVTVLDNGFARTAVFQNIPVGPVTSPSADCSWVLPCSWISPDGDVTITLMSAGGFAGAGRLTTNFTIDTTRGLSIVLDAGATAMSRSGTRFEGRTHSLGTDSGYQALTQSTIAGAAVAGSVSFHRTDTQPSQLLELALVLYEDTPVPRWNPVFLHLPVQ